jgi:flagellar motor switch protein FliG
MVERGVIMTTKAIDTESLSGPQKAAIFLLRMGEDYTSEIFKLMSEQEIRKAADAMTAMGDIPPEAVTSVLDEFVQNLGGEGQLMVQSDDFFKKAVNKALGDDKANSLIQEIENSKREQPFSWSRQVDLGTLSNHIHAEHPQTIAMILAYLPPEVGSEILSSMPEEMKGDVAMRIARLGQVPDEIIREVDEALRNELSGIGQSGSEAGGIDTLVSILGAVDKATEDTIMEAIEEESAEMANDIRQQMFVFEDLISVDDRGMREILKKVESAQLVLAMKTATDDMKQKITGNLSSRAAEMLLEDLEVMGPVKLSEVEEAQQAIIRAAKELEAEGTIALGGKGKEDILV